MKNRYFINKKIGNYSFVFLILAAFIFTNISCTEDPSLPSDKKVRRLTVVAKVRDHNSINTYPAQNAEVEYYKINKTDANNNPTETELLATKATNSSGVAIYESEMPAVGISAYTKCTYNNITQTGVSLIPFCNDTLINYIFENKVPTLLNCSDLPQNNIDSLVFVNENYSRNLIQYMPTGIAQYTAYQTLIKNTGSEAILVTIPNIPSPFALVYEKCSPAITSNPVTINPNETFTLCFTVSTNSLGDFDNRVVFNFTCATTKETGNIVLNLKAKVVELLCECPSDTLIYLSKSDKVSIGTTVDYTNDYIFTAPNKCGNVIIDGITSISKSNNSDLNEWKIVYPNSFPFVLRAGSEFYINTKFTPKYGLSRPDTFRINYHLENGLHCIYYFVMSGEGCKNLCPYISNVYPNPEILKDFREFSNRTIEDSLYKSYNPHRVEFSLECNISGIVRVDKSYTLYHADSACCVSPNISITVRDNDNISKNFFTVTPTNSIKLSSNAKTELTVSFISPTIQEFNKLFSDGKRTKTGLVADSTFTIYIDLVDNTCGCKQTLKIHSIVSSVPRISPIRNLRAYSQVTDLKKQPEGEVCSIDSYIIGLSNEPGLVYTLRNPQNGTIPVPPTEGDFYVDVADPSEHTYPYPQAPKFRFGNGYENACKYNKIKLVTSNYPEQDFDNISPIVKLLQDTYNANNSYFTSASLVEPVTLDKFTIGNVYVLYSSDYWGDNNDIACCIALMYIREIKDGSESNSNHQSAIEFRLINNVPINP